jgi:glycosyltransferase involved in cell wall biosynthesis
LNRRQLLFLSHNIHHPRCEYLIRAVSNDFQIIAPQFAVARSSRLSLNPESIEIMLNLGISALGSDTPMHLDGIDVFITPFMQSAEYVHDYHVPLVPELKWLGHLPLAIIAQALLPNSIRNAKAVIAPNRRMLAHAAGYAKLPDNCFVIPNYPLKRFYVDIAKEKARAKLNLPQDKQVVLFVGGGRLREIYGIEFLFDTWRQLIRDAPDALLYMLGPVHKTGLIPETLRELRKRNIVFPGMVPHADVPIWISAADLCVSQRTPGFPIQWYNIHDSMKLSEYALFEKPIVVAGYLPSPDYISADTTIESYSKAILEGLNGEAPKPTPHTWEENLPLLRKAYSILQ